MARRIRIPPEKSENIHGVRLAAAGACDLLMLALAGFGVLAPGGFGLAAFLAAAFFGLLAIVLSVPVLWGGSRRDQWLALLAMLPAVAILILLLPVWRGGP